MKIPEVRGKAYSPRNRRAKQDRLLQDAQAR